MKGKGKRRTSKNTLEGEEPLKENRKEGKIILGERERGSGGGKYE